MHLYLKLRIKYEMYNLNLIRRNSNLIFYYVQLLYVMPYPKSILKLTNGIVYCASKKLSILHNSPKKH